MDAIALRPQRDIAILTKARKMIAEARSMEEVKDIRDQGHAAIQYAKSRRDIGLETQNDAAEIVLRAERRLGEMLGKADLDKGGRPPANRSHDVTGLSDLGITKMQSHRWQTSAKVSEKEFDRFVVEVRKAGKQLTSGALVKLGRCEPDLQTAGEQAATADGVVSCLNELIESGQQFACVYADPPWRYGNQATRAATDNHYNTMTVEEICAEPVAQLTADICHLYLWTTAGFLREAFDVITAWGFTYKTNMVWVKPQMGIGNYVRLSHEHLMIAVKGQTRTRGSSQKSWLEVPRGKHSRKPDVFRAVVEKMSDGPYLELYGREKVSGWMVYGNQIKKRLFS